MSEQSVSERDLDLDLAREILGQGAAARSSRPRKAAQPRRHDVPPPVIEAARAIARAVLAVPGSIPESDRRYALRIAQRVFGPTATLAALVDRPTTAVIPADPERSEPRASRPALRTAAAPAAAIRRGFELATAESRLAACAAAHGCRIEDPRLRRLAQLAHAADPCAIADWTDIDAVRWLAALPREALEHLRERAAAAAARR